MFISTDLYDITFELSGHITSHCCECQYSSTVWSL